MSVLEDLIVNNRESYPDDLRTARNTPRDTQATADLKADEDRLERLAELAEVEREQIVDVAVRGTYATFQVADDEGVTSAGFFSLADLDTSGSRSAKKARKRGGVQREARPGTALGSVGHGTASTPSSDGEEGEGEPPIPPEASGVPDDFHELSRDKVIDLLRDPPEGVDPAAVVAAENAREDGPRSSVLAVATRLGIDGAPPRK